MLAAFILSLLVCLVVEGKRYHLLGFLGSLTNSFNLVVYQLADVEEQEAKEEGRGAAAAGAAMIEMK